MKEYLRLRYNYVVNISGISCLQCTTHGTGNARNLRSITRFRIEQFTAVTREVVGNEGKSASGNLER